MSNHADATHPRPKACPCTGYPECDHPGRVCLRMVMDLDHDLHDWCYRNRRDQVRAF